MTFQMPTRRSSAVAVLVGLALCGCGSSPASAPATATPNPASIEHGTISVGGLAHAYRLFRPQKLDAQNPTAMVVLLHGCGSSGDKFASITHFDAQAGAAGIVAVYPDGLANFRAEGERCGLGLLQQRALNRLSSRLGSDSCVRNSQADRCGGPGRSG